MRLEAAGLKPYVDVKDVVKGEPWRARLSGLIEQADVVLFMISPGSVASEVCAWEVNEAELLAKRIFPVVVAPTPDDDVPQRLRLRHFTFFAAGATAGAVDEMPGLIDAIRVDADWVREHTRYGELARRWDRANRAVWLLLRGAAIAHAETWRDTDPPARPNSRRYITPSSPEAVAPPRRADAGR